VSATEKILPTGWEYVTVADISDSIQYGHTASAIETGSGPRFLRITDIQEGRVEWSKVPSCIIADDDFPRYRLRPGDLVFARTGATTGKSFLIQKCPAAVFASYLIRVRVSPEIDAAFVALFFQSGDYWRQIEGGKRGVGQPNVNGKVLGQVKLPLPPPPEQHRIVAKIEELFSEIDKGIENLKQAKAQLAVYRQALLKHAFEGKLTADWRAANADKLESTDQLLARILSEKRKNGNGRGHYMDPAKPKNETVKGLPERWVWASPDQLSSAEEYSLAIGPFGSNLKVSDYRESGVPLVFVRNIRASRFADERTHYITAEKADELRAHSVAGGDILITKMGEPPGDASIYPISQPNGVITADCIKLRLSPLLPFPRFFLHFINSGSFRQQITKITSGVAQKKVSLARFRSLSLPLPPIMEQKKIVSELDAQISAIDAIESDIETNLAKSKALRQSILKKAFAGELVPQDPKNEPAAELLARIRAERASRLNGNSNASLPKVDTKAHGFTPRRQRKAILKSRTDG
jgi:type I restriction enzyme S subunit